MRFKARALVAMAAVWAFAGAAWADTAACDAPAPPPGSDTVSTSHGLVTSARFSGATRAYGHGVLGDGVEAEALLVTHESQDGVICDLVPAGANRVFEDISPRLVDVDGDGTQEVMVVASHAQRGARLEIYGLKGGKISLIALTPYIGRPFRWLAPVGAADLDGDGAVEIAYVDRPHLAKTLRVWRFEDGKLMQVAEAGGFSNHKIGWPFIAGGLRDCGAGPEMILANGDWTRVVAAKLVNGAITTHDLGVYKDPDSLTRALSCN